MMTFRLTPSGRIGQAPAAQDLIFGERQVSDSDPRLLAMRRQDLRHIVAGLGWCRRMIDRTFR